MTKRVLTIEQRGDSHIEPVGVDIPDDVRLQLGDLLGQMVEYGIAARAELEENLDYWNAIYEMRVGDKDWPWEDCSNFVVPFTTGQLDSLAAELTGVVFQPRFFIFNGNTPEAIAKQHKIERFFNAELSRHNWTEQFYQWLHLSLRDGVSILEILWRREKKTMPMWFYTPELDEMGQPVIGPDGKAVVNKEQKMITITVFNGVELTPVELRDFLILPAWQSGIQARGAGAARVKLMDEQELLGMCKTEDNPDGVLWEDVVQEELATLSGGETDLTQSLQSIDEYSANEQIDVASDVANTIPEYPRQRGPMRVWRIHTDALDLDGDGIFEENVFYVREQSRRLLGYFPYDYLHMRRPFVALSPIPRPNNFYGKSVCELLRSVQEELNSQHNQRNDQITLRLSPPFYRTRSADVRDQAHRTGPDVEWLVDAPNDVGMIALPEIPQSSWEEEQLIANYGLMTIGATIPTFASQGGSRKTAKEVQSNSASQNVRKNLMAARVREAAKLVLWQVYHLYLQFGDDEVSVTATVNGQPQRLTISKAEMALDYDLGISGMGGPLDKQGRMQEMMLVYSMLVQNPIVNQNPKHLYAVTRMVLEAIGVPDIQTLIGTPEELMQLTQQRMMMQKQQLQLQQADVQAQAQQRQSRAKVAEAKAQQAMRGDQQEQAMKMLAARQDMMHKDRLNRTRQLQMLSAMMNRGIGNGSAVR